MATVDTEKRACCAPCLPKYRDSLGVLDKKNYDEKLKYTAGIDPYSVSSDFYSESMEKWPEVEFPDIVNYLIFTTSQYTNEQLKALQKFGILSIFCGRMGTKYSCWQGN